MHQREFLGMQGHAGNQGTFLAAGLQAEIALQAGQPELFAAVKLITHDRKPGVLQVNANLMGPAGQRRTAQQTPVGKLLQHFKLRLRLFTVLGFHAHLADPHRVRCQLGIHFKRRHRRNAPGERDVFFQRLFGAKQTGQRHQGGLVLGEQDNAARLKIEPVGIAKISQLAIAGPRFGRGNPLVQQPHQVGPVRIIAIRRGQQAGRLVQRQQIRILEHDRDFPELPSGRRRQFDRRAHVTWPPERPEPAATGCCETRGSLRPAARR